MSVINKFTFYMLPWSSSDKNIKFNTLSRRNSASPIILLKEGKRDLILQKNLRSNPWAGWRAKLASMGAGVGKMWTCCIRNGVKSETIRDNHKPNGDTQCMDACSKEIKDFLKDKNPLCWFETRFLNLLSCMGTVNNPMFLFCFKIS